MPVFGYKNHVRIDCEHGFVRHYSVTHAAAHDGGGQLGAALDCDNTASDIWDDTAYRSALNLALLKRRGRRPQFQCKKPRGEKMPVHIASRAPARGLGLSTSLAVQKYRLVLLICAVGVMRVQVKIGLANFTRLAWLNARTASA
jgi:transposase, IS5 family